MITEFPANPAIVAGKPFNVLAIDGGGVRGLYTVSFLQSLARHFLVGSSPDTEIFLGSTFGLISGTSTGGILACGLAAGESTQRLIKLYKDIGPKVFTNPQPWVPLPPPGNAKGWFAGLNEVLRMRKMVKWAYGNLFKAANSSAELKSTLVEIFGGTTTLGDVWDRSHIALCIPACRMTDYSTKVFKTPHAPDYTRDRHVTLVDACMATSAAPIFLPLAEIREQPDHALTKFVDGGLWANNPSVVALLEAIELCTDPVTGKLKRPIRILSIGTSGGASGEKPGDSADRGLLGWNFGGEAAGMSIDVQGIGTHHITARFVKWFQKLGFDIQYDRVPNPKVTDSQAKELKLDRATPEALLLLSELGDIQAQFIQSECSKNTPLGALVNDIFKH